MMHDAILSICGSGTGDFVHSVKCEISKLFLDGFNEALGTSKKAAARYRQACLVL